MAKLHFNNINKVYDNNVQAVFDFNLDVEDKEFIVLVGPSGCGKSTTLRMVAGLEEITTGALFIDKTKVNNIAPRDRDIAMVFQSYALYPHMTVYNNMAFGLKLRKMPKEEIEQRVGQAAEILGLTEYLERKPKALSGGQRQRVALGRAIVRDPKVFLMDEPLSNLDAKLRVQMRSEIIKIHERVGATTLYVTHDQTEAMTMADRIVVMSKGWIQQIGTPKEVYRYPSNIFVATFIGSPSMNILKAHFDGTYITIADKFKMKVSKEFINSHQEFYRKRMPVLESQIDSKKHEIYDFENNLVKTKVDNLKQKYSEAIQEVNISHNKKLNELKANIVGETVKEELAKENASYQNALAKLRESANKDSYSAEFAKLKIDHKAKVDDINGKSAINEENKLYKETIKGIKEQYLPEIYSANIAYKADRKLNKKQKAKKLEVLNDELNKLTDALRKCKELETNLEHDIILGIRPEDIYCSGDKDNTNPSPDFKVSADICELLGKELNIYGAVGDQKIAFKVFAEGQEEIKEGEEFICSFIKNHAHAFDEDSTLRICGLE